MELKINLVFKFGWNDDNTYYETDESWIVDDLEFDSEEDVVEYCESLGYEVEFVDDFGTRYNAYIVI